MINNCSKSLLNFFSFSKEVVGALSTEKEPYNLYDPINHIISSKGKQVRSVFSLVTYDMFGGDIFNLKQLILAIEGLHNFSLIHDDVMDNAVTRRGLQTINKKWSNKQAILSGDVLLIQSYQHLLDSEYIGKKILKKFTETAILICEGQQLDIDFQKQRTIKEQDYFKMIELKTGVLINFALVAPSLLTDLGKSNIDIVNSIGNILGILFQIQDDYLDLYGDFIDTGKRIGGDIIENKKTFLYVTAFKKANLSQKKELESVYHSSNPNKIELVSQFYDVLGVKEHVQNIIIKFQKDLDQLIYKITVPGNKKECFRELIKLILNRKS